MSYINEALKKAQKEKDTQKHNYQCIVAHAPEKRFLIKSWHIFALLIILIIASVAITFFWLWQQEPLPNKSLFNPAKTIPKAVVINEPVITSPEQGKTESKPDTLPSGKVMVEQERGAKTAQPSDPSLPTQAIVKDRAEGKGKEVSHQRDIEILYREALASQKRHDLATAKRLYKELLNLDPRYVKAINNLGVIYMQQNLKGYAIQKFDRAISIKKDYVDPYYNMACLYARFSDLSRSMKYLQEAATINPEVRKWAKNDRDLKNINTSPEFLKFIGNVDGKEP
ncbi:MAG TPA: hypothetical protein DCG53_02060 [Syntrophus sp. (in: bacteria)]|jgi:tetratricopeptide (TPR) repeat protein|nr:hypothetical protein [Syntrophus sp. (in: bacteria)]